MYDSLPLWRQLPVLFSFMSEAKRDEACRVNRVDKYETNSCEGAGHEPPPRTVATIIAGNVSTYIKRTT